MDIKRLSQERFGRYAASYVTNPTHAGGPDLARLVELVGDNPDWEALDIATGAGHTALAVAGHVAHVIATDITEMMLATARDFIFAQGARNVTFQLADAEDLPYPARSFDLVTCRIAAHHFPSPERFVREVARVLRPGGLFLLQDQVAPEEESTALWISRFEKRRDPSHHRSLSETEWEDLLLGHGFVIETVDRFEKRLDLERWVGDQGGGPEDLAELRTLLSRAPRKVKEWMRPADMKSAQASFTVHHCLFGASAGAA